MGCCEQRIARTQETEGKDGEKQTRGFATRRTDNTPKPERALETEKLQGGTVRSEQPREGVEDLVLLTVHDADTAGLDSWAGPLT
jgi:hypothetical protein